MTIRKLVPVFLFAAALYAAPPVITSIQNPASNILPGLPNFGIAQGQIFVLYGTDMGPTTIALAPAPPLTTTLSGTSIKITPPGGAAPINAPIIYVLNTQIAAVMPSSVPLTVNNAFATVQVTYNGTAGNVFSTRIVDSNFGISTADLTGTGRAVITDANYTVITQANSTKPGSTYTMWGTGLGPTDSDNNFATKGTFPKIHVFVGGIEATVPYAGLSAGVGLNQINFTIPAGLSGCYVSLIVQSDTTPARVSNGPTIPIAANGGLCSDTTGFPAATINSLLASKGNFTAGGVIVDAAGKMALGFFLRFSPAQWSSAGNIFGTISQGSCVTSVQVGSGGQSAPGIPVSTGLDASTALTLTSPAGTPLSMPLVQSGVYFGNLTNGLSTGTYTVSNGAGGKDIGAFNVSINAPPAFAWTNSNISTVTRSQGFKVTWAGGDANTYVDITGYAGGNPVTVNGQTLPSNVGAAFECQAPAAEGSFTIPASVLLAMPIAVSGSGPNGNLNVQLQTYPQVVTIPGTDFSFVSANTANIRAGVAFQ